MVLDLIIQSFWFLLPAAVANMSPTLFKKINFLNYPIDFNKKTNGRPILGSNKTFRGFFFGTLMAILIIFIQKLLYPYMINYTIVDYSTNAIFLLGFLLGFGALAGDSIESFFKRRANINPGSPWIPFDQLDWVIGSLLLALIYVEIPFSISLTCIILFGLLHPTINLVGHFLKLQKNKI